VRRPEPFEPSARSADQQAMRSSDLALAAVVAAVFAPAVLAMARVWSSLDYYSHGFFVPFVSWWLFYARRKSLGAPQRDARGLAVIGACVAGLAVGYLAGSASAMGLALVGALCGLTVYFWGAAGVRTLAFPLGFLLFMVPIPDAVLAPVIVRFQLWVSMASVWVLQRLGFTLLREGNVVLLPDDQRLFVDEACSGITSVVTLLPLGALLAHFVAGTRARRIALMLAVVPIAMLGNGLRVLGTVAGARRFGVESVTHGPVHEFAGLATFVLACALLIGLASLLRAPRAQAG
jgi:exosortase